MGSLNTDFSQFGLKEARIFLRDLLKALTDTHMSFVQMFDDYDKYHDSLDTGFLGRAKLIEEWFEPGSKVLDAGIGDGMISQYLMKTRKLKLFGFDISKNACEKAAQRGIITQIRDISNGLHLDLDEFYDYILLSEVIEHTVNPQQILIDATQHAKKGVIVTIPNSAYIKWRIHLLRGYVPRQSFTHLHFWSIKDFELFCKLLNIRTLAFKTFLPKSLLRFRNLFAFQQCWLLAPHNMGNSNINK